MLAIAGLLGCISAAFRRESFECRVLTQTFASWPVSIGPYAISDRHGWKFRLFEK